MKSFNSYLSEQTENAKLEHTAAVFAKNKFPLYGFADWWLDEGMYMSKPQLERIVEGFWGDTLRGAGKGALGGAGIGTATGGVGGGFLGGALGALGGAAKGAWNYWQNNRRNGDLEYTKKQAKDVLSRLLSLSGGPEADPQSFGNLKGMIDKLTPAIDAIKTPADGQQAPQTPQSTPAPATNAPTGGTTSAPTGGQAATNQPQPQQQQPQQQPDKEKWVNDAIHFAKEGNGDYGVTTILQNAGWKDGDAVSDELKDKIFNYLVNKNNTDQAQAGTGSWSGTTADWHKRPGKSLNESKRRRF